MNNYFVKNNHYFSTFTVISVMAFTENGQVHIGGNTPARDGAILDLTNAGNLGVKLPLVDLQNDSLLQLGPKNVAELKNDPTAIGMTVYNTNKFELDGEGVYIWNGSKWTTVWAKGKIGGVVVPTPDCQSNFNNQIVFMKYNLGADPAYDTPKKQIKYLYDLGITTKQEKDHTVYGGLYQWGRKDLLHGNRNSASVQGRDDTPTDGTFYYGNNDWRINSKNDLWGNGAYIDVPTGDGIPYNDDFYQKPVKTADDPCPNGFRIPTQDEWKRIGGNYDCKPNSASSAVNFGHVFAIEFATTNLVWVRVHMGKALGGFPPETNYSMGYAIYDRDTWYNSAAGYQTVSKWLYEEAAPEPILFLPAAGSRNGSSPQQAGHDMHYWSSSVHDENRSYTISFLSLSQIITNSVQPRTLGCSICCVAENFRLSAKYPLDRRQEDRRTSRCITTSCATLARGYATKY